MFHTMYARVMRLVQLTQRKGIVDGDEDLVAALNGLPIVTGKQCPFSELVELAS